MATAVTIPASSGLLGQSAQVNRYFGFALRETAGAVGTVRIREASSSGKLIDTVQFLANESVRDWYGPQGILVNGDIYIERVTGTIEGTIRCE